MPWTTGNDHIRHIRDLETMFLSGASREYTIGDGPPGFIDYWNQYFRDLYLVGCLMYLEDVFGFECKMNFRSGRYKYKLCFVTI